MLSPLQASTVAPALKPAAALLVTCALAALVTGCATSSDYHEPGPLPQITNVTAPKTLTCEQRASGGACPITISVKFRLPEDQFVSRALVRFQTDGSDIGVDRTYALEYVFGLGTSADVGVTIQAFVPPTVLRPGSALYTYSVRLMTGAGEESVPTTLTVSVQGGSTSSSSSSSSGSSTSS